MKKRFQRRIMEPGKFDEHTITTKPVVRLASLWQRTTGAKMPMTPKNLGQLKMLSKKLGMQTFPLIDWVLPNWTEFTRQAKLAGGLRSTPPNPHIGFLLRYYVTAVSLTRLDAESLKPIPPCSPEVPEVTKKQNEAETTSTNNKVKEEPMTAAEFVKIMAALGTDKEEEAWAEIGA
jgi:hypothetical protein